MVISSFTEVNTEHQVGGLMCKPLIQVQSNIYEVWKDYLPTHVKCEMQKRPSVGS